MKKYIQMLALSLLVVAAAIYTACQREEDVIDNSNPGSEQVIADERYAEYFSVTDATGRYTLKFKVQSNDENIMAHVDEHSFTAMAKPAQESTTSSTTDDMEEDASTQLSDLYKDLSKLNRVRVELLTIISPDGSIPEFGFGFTEAFAKIVQENNVIYIYDWSNTMVETNDIGRTAKEFRNPVKTVYHARSKYAPCENGFLRTFTRDGLFHTHNLGKYCNKCSGSGLVKAVSTLNYIDGSFVCTQDCD